MPQRTGYRAFARFWDWQTRHESDAHQQLRREVVRRVTGRVLEIGFGVGANWPYLPGGISYTGIEPDPYMIQRSAGKARPANLELTLVQARGERLPFADASFDTVLVTHTLCSVTDLEAALGEARRVLIPGGALVYAEHVRPSGKLSSAIADVVTPFWRRVGAGCHLNRATAEAINAAGFQPESVKAQKLSGLPHVVGVARKLR